MAIRNEDLADLERAYDQLPENYREIITLSRLIGYSHARLREGWVAPRAPCEAFSTGRSSGWAG